MAARINEVADAVLALIEAEWEPALPDEVKRKSVPRERLRTMQGKSVKVFGIGYSEAERLARGRVTMEYRIAVDIAELYDQPASSSDDGPVPQAWVDERVEWVEANIFNLLNSTGVRSEDRLLGSLWPQTCEVDVVYDPVSLDTDKTFRSRVIVAYRERAEG